MTELDELIATAFASEGSQDDVNKVYLTLLKTILFVPIERVIAPHLKNVAIENRELGNEEEPFKPLFAKVDDNFFMLAFDTAERLITWAGDEVSMIDYVELSGRDVIAGIHDQVYLCVNLGSQYYKEFSPDEVKRLKMIVSRIDQLHSQVKQ